MSDRSFESAFAHTSIGMALVGEGGRFMRVNPSFCRLTGYDEHAFSTLTAQALTHPYDRMESDRLIRELWNGERQSYELEKRYIRKDGSSVWVMVSVSSVREPDGSMSHVVCLAQDISKRRAAEAAQRTVEYRYRKIAEETSDVILLGDLEGTLEYVSPSVGRYGWRPEDLVGQNFTSYVHPEDLPAAQAGIKRLLDTGDLDCIRWRARRGDTGEWRWFESHPVLVASEGEESAKILDVVRDVQDAVDAAARETEARLAAEAATKVKSEFLANISHEIRTPLTSVLGFTDLLRRRMELSDAAREEVESIHVAGQSLLALVNDVIDFSKLEAEQFEIRPRPTDVRQLVEEIRAMFVREAGAKGLTFDIAVDPSITGAHDLDPDRLKQILTNLISNAIKFTRTGGVSLAVSPHARDDYLQFVVTDTGEGISREALPQLFKRFSQVNGERARSRGGAGLGLAITKGLTEAMGGNIDVESAYGLGSVFQLTLPAPCVEMWSALDEEEPEIAGGRILVVDDNAANRLVAERLLQLYGFQVVCADCGPAALDLLSASAFDIVLMDIRMPKMDGLETLYRLRTSGGRNRHIPVLAFTADADREGANFADFDGLIMKPIDPQNLLLTFADVLRDHAPAALAEAS